VTRDETIACLFIIVGFFPHSFSLDDVAMVDLWHRELKDFDGAAAEGAVRHLCRTKDAFPSLKDVIDRLTPPAAMSATEAWRLVVAWADSSLYQIYDGGVPRPRAALPPDVAAIAETIGSPHRIATRSFQDETAMRAHFFRAWTDLEATRRDATARAAVGLPALRATADDAPQALGQLFHLALPEGPHA
jgi:hypothetical protein